LRVGLSVEDRREGVEGKIEIVKGRIEDVDGGTRVLMVGYRGC